MSRRSASLGASGNITPPFESVVRAAVRSEQQGFDAVWWADHLMSFWPASIWTPDLVSAARMQPNPHIHLDPMATMAAVAAHTEHVLFGTAVTDVLRRSPAVLAQQFLTLDHITKGRVILGIGAGEAMNSEPYGLGSSSPVSRMEEAIKIIRLLWQSRDPVDYQGRFWQLRGAMVGLPPYRPGRYPPIWVGGAAPRTLRIIGQLADGWLPLMLPQEEYGPRLATIRRAATNIGRDADAITYGLFTPIVVDRDHHECHRVLSAVLVKAICLALPAEAYQRCGYSHPMSEYSLGSGDYVPTRLERGPVLALLKAVPFEVVHEHVAHGTPEELVERFDGYIASGCQHIALQNVTYAGDESKLSASFHLMAQLPQLLKGL